MLDPADMKNKGVVIASIHNAQALFNEDLTIFKELNKFSRSALEDTLLTYVDRYRDAHVSEEVLTGSAEKAPIRGFVPFECPRCDGTGLHPLGSCYRCTNGIQTEDDQKRNYGSDLPHPRNKPAAAVAHAQAPADLVKLIKDQLYPEPMQKALDIEIGDTTPDFDEDDLPF